MTLSLGFRFLATAVLSFCIRIQAVPYEGYIYLQYHSAPIWVDVSIPAGNGPISGSYFYKRVGKTIPLKGERRGDTLHATEMDAKRAVTGTFTCTIHRDSLVGTWVGPKDVQAWRVLLFKAEPADKKFSLIPRPEDLRLAAGGTLADRIKDIRARTEATMVRWMPEYAGGRSAIRVHRFLRFPTRHPANGIHRPRHSPLC